MRLISAFFHLVRWPNLLFIALTQALFYACIYFPLYGEHRVTSFCLLLLASVFIAAAGYIINDYFDVNIDRVNKPQQNVVDNVIHRRWAILWHLGLSIFGVVLTAAAVGLSHWYVVLANLVCVVLLWFYSTSLKRQFLVGNVVTSLLTAWTVLVLFFAFSNPTDAFRANDLVSVRFFRRAFLYAGFAFIISLIREAIKDMEDLEGDARYGCNTMPVVAGIRGTKIYTATWLVVLIGALVVLQVYVLQFGWWPSVIYTGLLVIFPLLQLLRDLRIATAKNDFSRLSKLTKRVMLAGILSMAFFYFYR